MARDPLIALADIAVAIDGIAEETGTLTFAQVRRRLARPAHRRARAPVSEASRAIPESFKEKHADIRWMGVRDIGNVIRHQYASLSPSLILNVVRDELPRLRRNFRHPQGPEM
jgi:uncharacterized protein with HEPN domain